MKKESHLKEVISGKRHFPICQCGRRMDWIIIYRAGKKPHEYSVCTKCNAPELTRVSADGKITTFKLQPNGAFSLG